MASTMEILPGPGPEDLHLVAESVPQAHFTQ